jgi:hypothetical protein
MFARKIALALASTGSSGKSMLEWYKEKYIFSD